MKFNSVFDIIGPVMIGPSSSHTAGAARMGRAARTLFGKEPTWATIHLYESFAKTYKGHVTDLVLVGGLVNYYSFYSCMRQAFCIEKQREVKMNELGNTTDVSHTI